jgi:hypothetical protein
MAIPPGVRKEILNGDFSQLAQTTDSLRARSLIDTAAWSAILVHMRSWLTDALELDTDDGSLGSVLGIQSASVPSAKALPGLCCYVAQQAHRMGLTSGATDEAIGLDEDVIEKITAELDDGN